MHGRSIENAIAYIHGRIEKEIEGFAQSLGVSPKMVASRLANLLCPDGQRDTDRMPLVRTQTRQQPSTTTRTLERTSNARNDLSQTTTVKRRKLSRKQLKAMRENAKKARLAKARKAA